ncbi:ABC transporter substrate-binding protein [uncultured Paracoccus sp.]|uniref:ABC transporter substrate-binding protein n=1 Tax=uncultured Paracoccus sp. TaxID=189685 RepID=UPI0025DBCCF6|nr:ABC transporter substrate-binding protein [uncultured Paracoccus sp.]
MSTSDRCATTMSRKTFLRGFTALTTIALGGGALGIDRLLPGAALADQGGAPQMGGTLNFNLTGDPPNFDPMSGTSTVLMGIIAPCYNGLVRIDPNDPEGVIPDLATGWEISADGLSYTFPLVQTAKFHDGKPCTSADVKHTFDTIRNPPDGVISARRKLLANVAAIETPDDHTVVFRLTQPSPAFLTVMASCWMLVLPKHILEAKGTMRDDIVGTGPFRLARFTRGVSYELEKNPDYHVAGRPFLDKITGYVIPDSGTTWNYLQNGQLTLFYSIQGQDAGSFKTGGDVVVLESPATSYVGVNFNVNAAPFDNVNVRKALSIAIDRQAALNVTYNGQGQLGGLTVPSRWSLPPEELAKIPGYEPDGTAQIDEARRLLAEAGFPDGMEITVTVRKNPLFEPVGVFLKDQWLKIGVRARLDIQENAAYASNIETGRYSVSASGGSYALSDPDAVFGDDSACGGGRSMAVCTGTLEQLFQQQSIEMDEAKRVALVNQLEAESLPLYAPYVMYWRNRFMGMSKHLRGLKIHPNIDQNMRMEDVWLES